MSSQKIAERPKSLDVTVLMEEHREALMPMVHENGKSFDRLVAAMRIAAQENPDIRQCDPDSLFKEIQKCASDGLVPDAKEAVILPYWNKDKGYYEANYQPMVHGIIKRMRELGDVFSTVCEVVREKDDFYVDLADQDSLKHNASPFDSSRGNVVGAYVIFRDDKNRVLHREIMSREDLDKVRNASKSPNSPAWKIWETEMFRKAVLRRGSKYISIDNAKIRQLIERTDTMFDFSNQKPAPKREDPFGSGKVIEPEPDDAPKQKTTETNSKASAQGSKPAQKEVEKQVDPWSIKVEKQHVRIVDEITTKAVNLILDDSISLSDRKGILKSAVSDWKNGWPEHLHPVLKWVIDFSDKAIRRMGNNEPYEVELLANVQKVSKQIGVDLSHLVPEVKK